MVPPHVWCQVNGVWYSLELSAVFSTKNQKYKKILLLSFKDFEKFDLKNKQEPNNGTGSV